MLTNKINGDKMKISHVFLLVAATLPVASYANNFPTTDRVEYVLECMKNNGGKQEYLYKCSCAIDRIAQQLPYEEYVEASTALRYQSLGGERGAVFRDPDDVKKIAKKYKTIQSDANKACHLR
jgi:hypothetical protein